MNFLLKIAADRSMYLAMFSPNSIKWVHHKSYSEIIEMKKPIRHAECQG